MNGEEQKRSARGIDKSNNKMHNKKVVVVQTLISKGIAVKYARGIYLKEKL
jgi:hypothetical protein